MNYHESKDFVNDLKEEIARQLGLTMDKLPADVDPKTAGKILSTAPRTLSIWRSTGRYNLPYYKAGRMVRYRIADLIKFKASRMHLNTGEAARC